jgi:hypothetical protein
VGLTANRIIQEKLEDPNFATAVSGEEAAFYAQLGAVVIAATSGQGGPGHVAVVAPIGVVFKKSWGMSVPYVFNLGSEKNTGIVPVTQAFRKSSQPKYYIRNVDLERIKPKNNN